MLDLAYIHAYPKLYPFDALTYIPSKMGLQSPNCWRQCLPYQIGRLCLAPLEHCIRSTFSNTNPLVCKDVGNSHNHTNNNPPTPALTVYE